ncbi:rho GTPase-activating protein 7-like isoform X2 [Magnolia sinica]|uniref:rho GTPase-activating protein 7-like isoform X2 n=1 Tax=Magnolia sinica TaxID=86752 RepID=UPI00265B4681|nr:rho GTPase-activating protein 7-like isoform X2 [Magnolia sinica]
MVTRNVDSSHHQEDGGMTSNAHVLIDKLRSHAGNTVFKSGPLAISSKGIGWTSWKKRWFILTRTSLVFFRSDPSGLPQKGSEVNLTLGGIDLNNSGSVVVRADKKLLTVLFPDGRDGRAFTLKAETSEEMYEWKTALENALAQAPSAALAMGQNGIFRNDAADAIEGSFEQWRDRRTVKSLVIGRPILLALEDIDGGPSFLEKALRFIEQHGVRVEGILRQAADVDDVERRVQEYEQGKDEFFPDEDAHVVADCVKHALRELPSSPVPASCCTSLLEAFRSNRGSRVNAIRAAISHTFPDPNRRLLQRILEMMQAVVSHESENRMSTSAVAACMAPLLLRPLLAGDCEIPNEFDIGGDGSFQFLQAAAAANHAQAIVIILLEEFKSIFLAEGSFSPKLYSESEGTFSEESTDDEILEDDGYHDAQNDLDPGTDDDHKGALNGTLSECSGNGGINLCQDKFSGGLDSDTESPKFNEDPSANEKSLEEIHTPLPQHDNVRSCCNLRCQSEKFSAIPTTESCESLSDVPVSTSPRVRQTESTNKSISLSPSSHITKSTNKSNESRPGIRRQTIWAHTSARTNLPMESIDDPAEDEIAIQRLEITKVDLQNKIAKEVKGNAILQASLERRRQALHERRSALEQDVVRLQEQLQKDRDLRGTLEAGVNMPLGQLSISSTMDGKKVADLHLQLNQQHQHNYGSVCESCGQRQQTSDNQPTPKAQQNNVEITAPEHSRERLARSEDALHGARCEKVAIQEPPSLPNKQPPQKQHTDSAGQNITKLLVATASSSTEEPLVVGAQASSKKANGKVLNKKPPQKQQPDSTSQNTTKSFGATTASFPTEEPLKAVPQASSKKANGKVEGMVSTQSALTKLTNRLNFLKERRSHLVTELQILGTSRVPEGPLLSPTTRINSR